MSTVSKETMDYLRQLREADKAKMVIPAKKAPAPVAAKPVAVEPKPEPAPAPAPKPWVKLAGYTKRERRMVMMVLSWGYLIAKTLVFVVGFSLIYNAATISYGELRTVEEMEISVTSYEPGNFGKRIVNNGLVADRNVAMTKHAAKFLANIICLVGWSVCGALVVPPKGGTFGVKYQPSHNRPGR